MSARRGLAPGVSRAPRFASFLRPRAGRRLPRELHARHVGRLALELELGLRDPGFATLLSRIDGGGPVHDGNRVDLFFDGDRAIDAMLEAVAGARSELLLEAYIFTDDATGRRFSTALVAAAARGVTVRVVADAWGSFKTPSRFWRDLGAGGVEVRLFHRLFPRLWWQPFRDHRKLLVADREVGFTGGMNIADEYASFTRRRRVSPESMRDTHARVEGPAVWEMAAVFDEGWVRAGGEPLPASPQPAGWREGERILVLESRPGRGHVETAAVLAALVAAARERVWLTNGYFAPGHLAVALLGRAAQRGVDVRLLLPGTTDVPIVRHAGHGWYSRLLRRGVRIWEFGRSILHAKTVIADGHAAIVGSTNLDFRSFRFNAECNVVVLGDATGEAMEAAFLADLEASREIEPAAWRARGAGHRILDRAAGMLTPVL